MKRRSVRNLRLPNANPNFSPTEVPMLTSNPQKTTNRYMHILVRTCICVGWTPSFPALGSSNLSSMHVVTCWRGILLLARNSSQVPQGNLSSVLSAIFDLCKIEKETCWELHSVDCDNGRPRSAASCKHKSAVTQAKHWKSADREPRGPAWTGETGEF